MENYRELGGYTHLAALEMSYREWMVERIERFTGPLERLDTLHAVTLEKLYTEIVGKDPREQFRLERKVRGGD